MESVIRALDELVERRIIRDYAIGGATALMYFSAPTLTEDIDVFVNLKEEPPLVDLSQIYDYLHRQKGATVEREYVFVDGFPVQFLIPYDELSRQAFENAITVNYGGMSVKIFSLEYLMAIMIQLDKSKYRERMRVLIEENAFDQETLKVILTSHGLMERWARLRGRLGMRP